MPRRKRKRKPSSSQNVRKKAAASAALTDTKLESVLIEPSDGFNEQDDAGHIWPEYFDPLKEEDIMSEEVEDKTGTKYGWKHALHQVRYKGPAIPHKVRYTVLLCLLAWALIVAGMGWSAHSGLSDVYDHTVATYEREIAAYRTQVSTLIGETDTLYAQIGEFEAIMVIDGTDVMCRPPGEDGTMFCWMQGGES